MKKKFTDQEVDRMRSKLARRWLMSKSQVTDWEAQRYLHMELLRIKDEAIYMAGAWANDEAE